ncbi:MAG TPA: hypothetical protein PLR02_13895 [Rhodocyclaceae bacterium]|nr:hypothetical protein [Rhodocyclaceae bacterium]
MWVILLEAAVAVSLLLIIVWATWPKRSRPGEHQEQDKEEHHD